MNIHPKLLSIVTNQILCPFCRNSMLRNSGYYVCREVECSSGSSVYLYLINNELNSLVFYNAMYDLDIVLNFKDEIMFLDTSGGAFLNGRWQPTNQFAILENMIFDQVWWDKKIKLYLAFK